MLILKVLSCDECLDVIDSQSVVDRASCTLKLAVLVADSAADCREWVISLDQLESISVLSSGCHVDVTLNSDMERACSLTWCSTCRPCLDDAVLILVVPVPLILRPEIAVRQFLLRIFDLTVLGAELLTESDSACRADLYTLTACYALFSINF